MSSILQGIEGAAAHTAELAIGYGAGAAVGAILGPATVTLEKKAWDSSPVKPTELGTLARLRLLGFVTGEEAAAAARLVGYDEAHFQHEYLAQLQVPGAGELLELLRRKRISDEQARLGLRQGGLSPAWISDYLALSQQHLSPTDAAMARQQGFIDVARSHEIAALGGLDAGDADLLYEMAGLPPGIGEALTLLRRNFITEERFAQMVREGHTKTKYTSDLLRLIEVPASPAEAAAAVVRQRISHDEGVRIASMNGVTPATFALMVETAGRPIGIMQALTLYNRGEFTRGDVQEVVARSNVRTQYTDDILKLAVHYPPLFQVGRLVTSGAVDDAYAIELIVKQGYPHRLAEGIVHAAHHSAGAKHRELSASIIEALYEAGLDTHPEAEAALQRLGYTQEQAAALLNVFLARRIVSEIIHGLTMIRARYTAWKIDRPTAETEVGTVSGNGEVWLRLSPIWDAEREANAPVLTPAQIGQGFHRGRFSFDEAMQKLQERGHSADDALTLLWIVIRGDPRPAPPAAA